MIPVHHQRSKRSRKAQRSQRLNDETSGRRSRAQRQVPVGSRQSTRKGKGGGGEWVAVEWQEERPLEAVGFSQGDGGSRGGYSRHLRAWCCGRSLYKAEGLMIRVQIRDSNVVPGGLHVLREGSPTNPTRSRSREQKLIYYKGGVWHHWHCS